MLFMVIFLTISVGPAIALMLYIYKQDRVEKEPFGLLAKLFGFGALSTIAAMVLEYVLDLPLRGLFHSAYSMTAMPEGYSQPLGYVIAYSFFVVGVAEEGAKFFFLRLGSWKNPNFDFRFDGIVYAVAVSLGFAAAENVLYVAMGGFGTAVVRALLSIPGHMAFGVVMGYFYSRAKLASRWGDGSSAGLLQFLGVIAAVVAHGFYDCFLFIGSGLALVLFALFVIALFIVIFTLVRREARQDHPV